MCHMYFLMLSVDSLSRNLCIMKYRTMILICHSFVSGYIVEVAEYERPEVLMLRNESVLTLVTTLG